MGRFSAFSLYERAIIRTAMEWSQSEFYDPGHTKEDRDTLEELLRELAAEGKPAWQTQAPAEDAAEPEEDDDLPFTMTEPPTVAPTHCQPGRAVDVWAEERAGRDKETAQDTEPTAGFDRGGHPVIRYPGGRTERMAAEKPTRKVSGPEQQQAPREYTGFLLIECEQCGDRHAFNAKMPISAYRCRECGGRTPLDVMSRLRVVCECGRSYGYMTNIQTDRPMDVACFNCGCPVAVEWNDRRGRYEPIDFGKRKQKNGRRKK